MSRVLPTDKVLVQRAATLHSAPADMSTVQDTDLLLINRAGVDYKCSFLDWKASQTKPPAIASVTLADSPEAGRFTSGTFRSTVVMTDEGIPASSKGIKAYVQGTLKTQAETSAITKVEVINNATSFTQAGGGVINRVDGGVTYTATPVGMFDGSDLTGFGAYSGAWQITLNPPIRGTVFKLRHKGADPGANIRINGVEVGLPDHLGGTLPVSELDISATVAGSLTTVGQGDYGSRWARFIDIIVDGAPVTLQYTLLTFTDATDLAKFAGGDAITEVTAAGSAGDATAVAGHVDVTAKTMALTSTTGTWDVGSAVKGPLKVPPGGASVKLFCKLNPALHVTDLQSADPGYTAVTGAGPYTVTFPATLPTGAAPDVDLPAGTSLTTEVQAVNASATVTKTSNTVTPA